MHAIGQKPTLCRELGRRVTRDRCKHRECLPRASITLAIPAAAQHCFPPLFKLIFGRSMLPELTTTSLCLKSCKRRNAQVAQCPGATPLMVISMATVLACRRQVTALSQSFYGLYFWHSSYQTSSQAPSYARRLQSETMTYLLAY